MPNPSWPAQLQLLRHAESVGNVARDEAIRRRLPFTDIAPFVSTEGVR